MSHKHNWQRTLETIVATYPLKKNSGGVKEIRVSSPGYVCADQDATQCAARAVRSPWTGRMIEIEPA